MNRFPLPSERNSSWYLRWRPTWRGLVAGVISLNFGASTPSTWPIRIGIMKTSIISAILIGMASVIHAQDSTVGSPPLSQLDPEILNSLRNTVDELLPSVNDQNRRWYDCMKDDFRALELAHLSKENFLALDYIKSKGSHKIIQDAIRSILAYAGSIVRDHRGFPRGEIDLSDDAVVSDINYVLSTANLISVFSMRQDLQAFVEEKTESQGGVYLRNLQGEYLGFAHPRYGNCRTIHEFYSTTDTIPYTLLIRLVSQDLASEFKRSEFNNIINIRIPKNYQIQSYNGHLRIKIPSD